MTFRLILAFLGALLSALETHADAKTVKAAAANDHADALEAQAASKRETAEALGAEAQKALGIALKVRSLLKD